MPASCINAVRVSFIVISVFVIKSVAIDCWVCTSAEDHCGENIDSLSLQGNYRTESGCAGCGKSFKSLGTLFSSVERTCLTEATDTCDNKLGYGYCTCSTTFCNGQSPVKASSLIIFAVGLLVAKLSV